MRPRQPRRSRIARQKGNGNKKRARTERGNHRRQNLIQLWQVSLFRAQARHKIRVYIYALAKRVLFHRTFDLEPKSFI